VRLVTKLEKLVLKFLLASLTLGVLAMVYKNKLLEPDPIPKEIQQAAVFQADANSGLLEHSIASTTVHTNAAVEKSKESSQVLVNFNAVGKGELGKLPLIGPVTAERVIRYRNDFGGFNIIEELKNVKGIGSKTLEKVKTSITLN
jgi:competence protein ComEA